MKRILLLLCCVAWQVHADEVNIPMDAPGSLFNISFTKNLTTQTASFQIQSRVPGKTYPNAGIKLLNHKRPLIGCRMNTNGWCLFELSDKAPTLLALANNAQAAGLVNFGSSEQTLPLSATSPQSIQVSVSLNAAGQTPLTTQTFSISLAGNQPTGKLIGYLNGYQAPLPVTDLVNAGYTHIIIDFAVFNTTYSGDILNLSALSGFSDFNQSAPTSLLSYIQQLHNAGIKVLLSIGGAYSSLNNTTVSFYEAGLYRTPAQTFQDQLIQNLKKLSDTYGFDGFDFDIESGLYATQPFGDVASSNCLLSSYSSDCTSAYLINIINELYTGQYYSWNGSRFLISLAPQLANIAWASVYNNPSALYSSILMQTSSSLAWSGVQLYNAGSIYGPSGPSIEYGVNLTGAPDGAVAAAADMLVNWGGSGHLSYTTPAGFNASQVVLGYAINSSNGDGSPVAVPSVTLQAINCIRTGNGAACGGPTLPASPLGGVFAFTVNSDAQQGYAFAEALYYCAVQGLYCS
jgi:chitinase